MEQIVIPKASIMRNKKRDLLRVEAGNKQVQMSIKK